MVRQADKTLALLGSQLEIEKALKVEKESAGLADERYKIYLESIEAAQGRFIATWQELAQSGATSDLIVDFYDLATQILEVVNAIGGMKTVLGLATVALIAFGVAKNWVAISGWVGTVASLTMQLLNLTATMGVATTVQWALNAAMIANPIGVVIAAIGLLVGAYALLSYAMGSAQRKTEELNKSLEEHTNKLKSLKDSLESISELQKTYKELKKAYDETGVSSKEFFDVQNQLKELIPGLAGQYDELGNFILDNKYKTEDLTKATYDLIIAEEAARKEASKAKALDMVDKLSQAGFNKIKGKGSIGIVLSPEQKENIKKEVKDLADSIRTEFSSATPELKQDIIDALKGSGTASGIALAKEFEISLRESIADEGEKDNPEIEVEVKAIVSKESQDAFDELVKNTIDMLKQIANVKKDALQLELKNLKTANDGQRDYYKFQLDEIKRVDDEKKKALEREIAAQKELYDSQKRAIEEQLKAYKGIIDNQKESIRLKQEEENFNNARAEKEKDLSEIQNQIAILGFDNSEEAIAKRLTLEAQASQMIRDLAQSDYDRTVQLQMEALDAEQKTAEETANIQLTALEETQRQYDLEAELRKQALDDDLYSAEQRYTIITKGLDDTYNAREIALQNQIAQIDTYLSQEGVIRKQALDMLTSDNSTVYQQLLDWNKLYGTGIEKDIIDKWDLARQALEAYKAQLETTSVLTAKPPTTATGGTNDYYYGDDYAQRHHDGANSGFVGGSSKLKSNEKFAKLLKGELVLTEEQMNKFMIGTLPSLMGAPSFSSNSTGGNISVNMPINVSGNLDSSVIPDIKKISERVIAEINSAMGQRGFNRRADAFSI